MIRTILVTQVRDSADRISEVFGRQDLVTLYNKGLTPIGSYKAKFEMSDSDFAKYGKRKE